MKVLKRKNKICAWCGAEMVNVHCNEKYCYDCKALIKNGRMKKLLEKERARQEEEKKKQKGLSLTEIVRLADAEGTTYAKYCLKYGI